MSQAAIRLLEGLGVEGDAHMGKTVKHRSRVRADPTQPNLRQVHLIHRELLDELAVKGFDVGPGALGENILTSGLDLLGLPANTILRLGKEAEIRVTGLRDPCKQLEDYQAGLLAAVLDRDAHGRLVRKAGIMGVVRRGGLVRSNDTLEVEHPLGPHRPLEPV
jgi:MOSC domain-containing protein YiiM